MISTHEKRMESVLRIGQIPHAPVKTIFAFQNNDAPTKYYPIRFTPPSDFSWGAGLKQWRIVLVEVNEINRPLRYLVIHPDTFKPEQWINDNGRVCLSITTEVLQASMIPVAGNDGLVEDDVSLFLWLQKRMKGAV